MHLAKTPIEGEKTQVMDIVGGGGGGGGGGGVGVSLWFGDWVSLLCLVFRPAFRCCMHPKASENFFSGEKSSKTSEINKKG